MKLHVGIVVNEVVDLLAAETEGSDGFPLMEPLEPVGDVAVLVQVQEPIAEHLRMDSQVIVAGQPAQHRIGNLADPRLQRAAVLYEQGDVLADLQGDLVHLEGGHLGEGLGDPEECRDLVLMEVALAEGAGHLVIDLGDDVLGRFGRRQDDINGDAQGAIALASGGVTWMSATSTGSTSSVKSAGISERKQGV